jgi:pimeloyl-ACP methyl ester carboxylesterase
MFMSDYLMRKSHGMYSKLRKLFPFLALQFVLIWLAVPVMAQKAETTQKPVFVIVHGAWGGSWAFGKVDSLMTKKDCMVYRPSLTGLGERVHLASPDVSLSTHIADVVNTVLFENLDNIILVGHSYGGMVITGVADRIPGRISKLVYLDAMVPEDGENVIDLMDPKAEGIAKMIRGDYVIPVWVKPDQKPPKDVPQPLKTFTERIVLKNGQASNIPSIYILTVDAGKRAKEDNFAPSAERARARGWKVVEMTADHNPQRSAVRELVQLLLNVR